MHSETRYIDIGCGIVLKISAIWPQISLPVLVQTAWMFSPMSDLPPAKKSKAQVFGARLFSTLLLWAMVAGVFLSGSVCLFIVMMTLLALLGVWEYFQMTQSGGMPSQPRWGMLISLVYLLLIGWKLGSEGHAGLDSLLELDVAFVILAVIGGLMWQLRRAVDGKKTVTEVAVTTLGFIYVAVLFSFLSRLFFVPADHGSASGAWLVIWLVAVTSP